MKALIHFSLLLLTLELTHLCVNVSPVHCQCSEQQKLSLLQLKKSLILGDSASKLLSWKSSTDCCSWAGVTCTEGRVVGLDISSQSISGGLDNSSSLFDLQHLESLNLAYNSIGNGSQIPSTIGKLKKLSYLNLSFTDFAGQIPIEISQLTRLVSLDLSYLYFPGTSSWSKLENPNLKALIQNLSGLVELHLDYVNISAQGTEWCQAISSSLPKLRVLSLSRCNLAGPIDISLLKLNSLSVIYLENNDLSAQVPDFFSNFTNLTSLQLSYCDLYGVFPKKIFQVPTLQRIDLSHNPQLQVSLPKFPKNGSLRSLALSSTNFSGLFPDSIRDLKMLSLLYLSDCNFSGPIPELIADLTELVYLDLSNNKFNGSVPLLSGAKNLTYLYLYSNDLTGQINYTQWENHINLVDLDLSYNQLEGSIPSTLFSLPKLSNLWLDGNKFSGQLDELFSNVSSYSLENLYLSSNNLEGPIPMSILKLRGLESLFLSSNNFSGSFLLNDLQPLRNLSALGLSFNNLSVDYNDTDSSESFPQMYELNLASVKLRRFPDFLRNQSELEILNLSQNQIHGEIPSWIWRLSNLQRLNLSYNSLVSLQGGPFRNLTSILYMVDLHSNQLQGQIPLFLQVKQEDGYTTPAYLDYSSNNFSSTIPADIGDFLNYTYFLSLSSNNFHGAIPPSICNAPYLEVLDLSNNSLNGSIPRCLTEISGPNLAVLNLGRNNIYGTTPDQFSINCSLKTLDLNGNQIDGSFPKSLGKCTKLEVLNLGNNQIVDTFPLMLKNTTNLRVLILRSNQFYGRIECPQGNGNWSNLQVLHIADNNFKGEIPGKCLATWRAMMGEVDVVQSKLEHFRYQVSSGGIYYQDVVTVTNKGLEMVLTRILNVFTSIDISNNNFNGAIPEEMGELKSLKALNLSSNALTGAIPSSLSNLRQLESLDIANNKLEGTIPQEFAKLNFLSFMIVSNNQLVGMIPKSTQISTFPASWFAGNKGLYGPPLTGDNTSELLLPTSNGSHSNSRHGIDRVLNPWIGAEIGFIVGLGFSIGSLVFCKRWNKWYYRAMYNILLKIFPQLEERIGHHRRHVHISQMRKRNTS